MILRLPASVRSQIAAEAGASFPHECCGLIEGVQAEDGSVRALALHPTANLAADPAAGFEIDPAVHLRLLRELRGSGRAVVGCYHSHPNGRTTPSLRDRACEVADGFVWVIAALAASDGPVDLTAFAGPDFLPVDLRL